MGYYYYYYLEDRSVIINTLDLCVRRGVSSALKWRGKAILLYCGASDFITGDISFSLKTYTKMEYHSWD